MKKNIELEKKIKKFLERDPSDEAMENFYFDNLKSGEEQELAFAQFVPSFSDDATVLLAVKNFSEIGIARNLFHILNHLEEDKSKSEVCNKLSQEKLDFTFSHLLRKMGDGIGYRNNHVASRQARAIITLPPEDQKMNCLLIFLADLCADWNFVDTVIGTYIPCITDQTQSSQGKFRAFTNIPEDQKDETIKAKLQSKCGGTPCFCLTGFGFYSKVQDFNLD